VSSPKRRKRRPRKPPQQPADSAASESGAPREPSLPARRRRAASLDERPPAPWGNVPLVELVVLAGIVMLVVGFIAGGRTGTVLIAAGAILCSLAGLELSIREHFGGFRSHTFVLSGAVFVALMAALYFLVASLWLPIAIGISLLGFVAMAVFLTRVFQRRAGRAFKLR
jgi:hypothetical protein